MLLERYIMNYMGEFNRLDRNFWNYEDGCVLIGAEKLYHASGEEFYYDCIKNYVDRYVSENGEIKGYEEEEYNLDRIPAGLVLFLLYEKTSLPKYRSAMARLRNQLTHQPRTESGSFWHKKIYPYQVWLDGLYMAMPYYLTYERRFGNGEGYEDILLQFDNARRTLFDEEKKLYYHAFDEKKQMFWADKQTGLSENFWSRAMGWYLMALADCLELFAGEEKFKKRLSALFSEAVEGLLPYQDRESGLFYQLTALPGLEGNYLETSASLMFAYALFKGVRLGVLPESPYLIKGEEIFLAVETEKFALSGGRLQLTGMCKGAGLGPENNRARDGSRAYYLKEPVVADEQKGAGALMMAYSEWLLLKKKGPVRPETFPRVEIWNGNYTHFFEQKSSRLRI
ncbi:glycoside hydrolase family 88/105 protein [Lacrimispora indolis]|uniref:glycoside hydrolase family 88/105 protein n=2 Tax=Lacrimispora indolis TaxID=69825 RepID=UPI00045EA8A8|nr:glycoside hydrolase family 88 protein [Lacrimispora indolis]